VGGISGTGTSMNKVKKASSVILLEHQFMMVGKISWTRLYRVLRK
jgi:hypothetical protein